jgi:hypothetical protein
VTKSPTPYDPQTDRYRLERYRILLAAQTDADIREMLEKLIDEAEERFRLPVTALRVLPTAAACGPGASDIELPNC